MKTSEQISELASALAKAQGQIRNPIKNRTATIPLKDGRKYSYDYSDLPSCFDAAREALWMNEISHPASFEYREGGYCFLVMRLMHSSGQFIESEWLLARGDEKTIAASMTYGTRYLFCSLTGMSGEQDVDCGPPDEEEEEKDKKEGPKFGPREGVKGPAVIIPPKPPEFKMGDVELANIKSLRKAATMSGEYFVKWLFEEKKITFADITNLSKRQYDEICEDLKTLEVKEIAPWEQEAMESPDPRMVK